MVTSSTDSIATVASRLQGFLASPGASKGLLSDLRRGDIEKPSLAALGCVMQSCRDSASTAELNQWLAVAKAYALAGPQMHLKGRALGTALRAAGMSEQRFERLLAAPAELRQEMMWRTCRYLKAKQERFDFVELAQWLLWRNDQFVVDMHIRQSRAYLVAK